MTEAPWTTWVPRPIHEAALAELRQLGEVVLGYGPGATVWEEVADRCDAVLLRTVTMGAAELALAPRLRLIAKHGVGVDMIDLEACRGRGVMVTAAVGANGDSVAELVIALTFAVARQLQPVRGNLLREGWDVARSTATGMELSGATMGVVGLGDIGRRVAARARALGMAVIGHDPYASVDASTGIEQVELAAVLRRANVLTVHLPLLSSTRGLLGQAELAALPRGAVVINTARGGIVDETALLELVRSGHLRGAGLDVVEDEPLAPDSPLLADPRIVLTPHIGGQTDDALRRTGLAAVDAVRRVRTGRGVEELVDLAAGR